MRVNPKILTLAVVTVVVLGVGAAAVFYYQTQTSSQPEQQTNNPPTSGNQPPPPAPAPEPEPEKLDYFASNRKLYSVDSKGKVRLVDTNGKKVGEVLVSPDSQYVYYTTLSYLPSYKTDYPASIKRLEIVTGEIVTLEAQQDSWNDTPYSDYTSPSALALLYSLSQSGRYLYYSHCGEKIVDLQSDTFAKVKSNKIDCKLGSYGGSEFSTWDSEEKMLLQRMIADGGYGSTFIDKMNDKGKFVRIETPGLTSNLEKNGYYIRGIGFWLGKIIYIQNPLWDKDNYLIGSYDLASHKRAVIKRINITTSKTNLLPPAFMLPEGLLVTWEWDRVKIFKLTPTFELKKVGKVSEMPDSNPNIYIINQFMLKFSPDYEEVHVVDLTKMPIFSKRYSSLETDLNQKDIIYLDNTNHLLLRGHYIVHDTPKASVFSLTKSKWLTIPN